MSGALCRTLLPPSQLLDAIAGHDRARLAAEVEQWRAVVAWAENNLHDGSSERHVDDVVAALDTGMQLAGEGTPAVSELALHELIAVLGRSPESGRIFVSRILEAPPPPLVEEAVRGRLETPATHLAHLPEPGTEVSRRRWRASSTTR